MGLSATRTSNESPLSAAKLREHLRGSEVSDDYLSALAFAATDYAEGYTYRTLLTATMKLTLGRFPEVIRLPGSPVAADDVASVKYVDSDGTLTTLDTSLYRVTSAGEPVCITRAYGASWPTPRAVTEAVEVNYTAGYGTSLEDAPKAIRQAVLLLVEHFHDAAEARYAELQAQRLLDPYRLGAQLAFGGLDNPCKQGLAISG